MGPCPRRFPCGEAMFTSASANAGGIRTAPGDTDGASPPPEPPGAARPAWEAYPEIPPRVEHSPTKQGLQRREAVGPPMLWFQDLGGQRQAPGDEADNLRGPPRAASMHLRDASILALSPHPAADLDWSAASLCPIGDRPMAM